MSGYALDFRPTSLDDVWGNEATLQAVKNWLSLPADRRQHAILLHGPTGCGKTTIAKIIATELNCNNGLNFIEKNAADDRGIDAMRKLVETTSMRAMNGGNKIYLLDECHQLTNDAQNVLLTPLEKLSEKVYFILCTTDPQKLIKTIPGRCLSLPIEALQDSVLSRHLKNFVLDKKLSIAESVIEEVVKQSNGSPRNALSLLETCVDLPENSALEILKNPKQLQYSAIDLCRLFFNGNIRSWKDVARQLTEIKELPETVRLVFAGYAKACLLKAVAINNQRSAAKLLEIFTRKKYIDQNDLTLMCWQAFESLSGEL